MSFDYGTLNGVKRKINLDLSITSADTKLTELLNEAEGYINTQIKLHATSPISPTDADLTGLSTRLAAASYNYWTSPKKSDKLYQVVIDIQKEVVYYILATYGRKNPDGHAAGVVFTKTVSAIDGF